MRGFTLSKGAEPVHHRLDYTVYLCKLDNQWIRCTVDHFKVRQVSDVSSTHLKSTL